MNNLSPNRLGLALGITGVFFYVGCMLLMSILSKETFVLLANSLCHGIDMGPIIRMDIPRWESIIGITEAFLLCGMFGYITAFLYNKLLRPQNE